MTQVLDPPQRGFPDKEFAARLHKMQDLMRSAELDAVLLTTEECVRYFSGFLTQFWQSPTRPWFLVIPSDGKPIAIIPTIGEELMRRTWIEDIRCWSSPAAEDDGVSLLAQAISECLIKYNRVGVPKGREYQLRMPLADFFLLQDKLPTNVSMVDATNLIRTIRMTKSPREIAKIRYVCLLISGAFNDAGNLFQIGQSEAEAFRVFKIACLQTGVDDVSYLVGSAEPGGYGDIISPPSKRPIEEGDVIMLDTGSVFDGYFCDFDRNFAFGSADEKVQKAYDTVWQATEAGFAAARPGARCCDLFNAMNSVLESGGALGNDVGRLGHGLGIQLTEAPSHTSWDETVLEAGMVLTLEPGMTFSPGKMMVHEENILITDDGAEWLTTRASPQLPII